MYFAEELSARDLKENQIEALWILADGIGHSNRDISKKLSPKWGKNRTKREGHCLRDVIFHLNNRGLIFSEKRKGKMTTTGKHDEIAYFIKRIALGSVHFALKDQFRHKYHNYLNYASGYKKGLLSPEEKKNFLDARARFQALAILEMEVNAYNDSFQKLIDLDLKHPDDADAAGFLYGNLPPDEKYFFLGKSVQELKALGITHLKISWG